MRKLLVGLAAMTLLVSSLVAGTTVAGTVSTAAAPTCTTPGVISSTMSPATVVLGPRERVAVEQTVRLQGNCMRRVLTDQLSPTFARTVELTANHDPRWALAAMATRSTAVPADQSGWQHRSVIAATELTNADAGTWSMRTYGRGPQRFSATGADFRVLRAAQIRARMVSKVGVDGRQVAIRGRLSRADWDHDRFGGYGSKMIMLQRLSSGGDYQNVRTLRSRHDGHIRTTVSSDGGCFRLVFAGDGATAPTTSSIGCSATR